MAGLTKWVDELIIYDSDDRASRQEANFTNDSDSFKSFGGIEGVTCNVDVENALAKYVNLKQVTFITHGFPGGVSLPNGSIDKEVVEKMRIPPRLFLHEGRLLFMGCDTAYKAAGEEFLIAAGRRFFAGKGGIVGGATSTVSGFPTGSQLPILSWNVSGGISVERGALRLIKIDKFGKVTGSKTVPAG